MPQPLRAIVVGGGIAGLATALSLREAGYSVTVLEKEESLRARPGGIRCPPNITRLLDRWLNKLMSADVLSNWPVCLKRLLGREATKIELQNCYHKCERFNVEGGLGGNNSARKGNILIDDDLIASLQAEFLYIPRADLLELLVALVVHETVEISCSRQVVNLSVKTDEIEVHLRNGESMTADLLVGADGHNSVIRNLAYLAGPYGETEEKYLATLYFTVPKDIMEADNELRDLIDHPTHWPTWIAKGYSMSGNVIELYGDFGVSIVYEVDRSTLRIPLGRTTAVRLTGDLPIGALGSIPTKLIKNARDAFIEIIRFSPLYPMRNRLVSDDGRIVLVGQAAHPLAACGLFSAAPAIEEAALIGGMQSYARKISDIPKILVQYEEIAKTNCTIVHQCDECHTLMLSCLDSYHGEQQVIMISQTAEGDRAWRKLVDVMRVDVYESVEAWWNNWGKILQPELVMPLIVVDVVISQHAAQAMVS